MNVDPDAATPEFLSFLSFIVGNGRAVLYPVYKGTFERGDPALAAIHNGANTRQFTEYAIQLVKDYSTSIDYLETQVKAGGRHQFWRVKVCHIF